MSACALCGAATQSTASARFCPPCEVVWKGSPEFKRATYFSKLKQPGPARSALSDFVHDRQKIRQAEEADTRARAEAEKKKSEEPAPAPKAAAPEAKPTTNGVPAVAGHTNGVKPAVPNGA